MTYDAADRLSSMQTGAFSGNGIVLSSLLSDISYTLFGALQSETYGNGLIHSIGYNNRLQPTEIRLGRPDNLESVFRIGYIFGTAHNVNVQDPEITLAHNNGNIARIKYFISGTMQYAQTFQYDPLNRLRYAVEHNNGVYNDGARAWYQTFDYDRWGNRGINTASTSDNVDGANSALPLAELSGVNNRITRVGYSYDDAGNLTAEPGKSYTYDAENRLVAAVVGGATSQYVYDGNGQRVKKTVGGVGLRFEYGARGELIAERNDAGVVTNWYYYRNGELLATSENGTTHKYATSDHLGSPRAWTGEDGNLTVGGRHDYLPFGEELTAGVGIRSSSIGYGEDSVRQKFAGEERDDETGLDFFGARYYASVQGRFTSVDEFNPILGKQGADDDDKEKAEKEFRQWLSQPARWNRYTYCLNNPVSCIDPDGMDPITVNLNIIFDEKSNYKEEEKNRIRQTYIEQAKKEFGTVDIKFNITETVGRAINLGSETRQTITSGAVEGAINVFFTESRVGSSTEASRYHKSDIFLNTVRGDPSDLTHGVIHVLGVASGVNGYRSTPKNFIGANFAAIVPGYAEHHTLVTADLMRQKANNYYGNYAYAKTGLDPLTTQRQRDLNVIRQGAQKYLKK